ncbi:MAG TPA: DUF2231 domain-containing protein [Candidatus Binataceae bacterium]|nr:DUF2231 domain-containing protein [Candidatus Binataceae bacterium]
MEGIISFLKPWQLHPPATHFAIVLLTTAVVADLIAVLFSTRLWLRYMATTLMIAGALATGLSFLTGLAEYARIGQDVTGKAQSVLAQHKLYGEYVMYAFGVLALWRIGMQAIGFLGRAHGTYVIVAVVALGFLFWDASSGTDLVYTYGVGTKVMAASMGQTAATSEIPALAPTATASPTAAAMPLARETPTATMTPVAIATPLTPAAEPSPTATSTQTPAGKPTGASL